MITINKIIYQFLIIITVFTLFVTIFFIPIGKVDIINYIDTDGLLWPAPGYYGINSYFGKRNAPTAGASSFHKGIDIGAPKGSPYIAVTNGTITFADFLGRWRIYNNINR